jgi:response regulator RpfG family c-di-GMP phosphodiesterase
MHVPSEKDSPKWREKIFEFTRIKTIDSVAERKGQLLAMFFMLIGCLVGYILLNDTIHLILFPSMEYAIYVVQELCGGILFYALWRLNRHGNVQLAAYLSISLYIMLASLFSPPAYLEYLMVAFALPIGISSFVISPSSSFVFALLTAISYTVSSFLWGYAWEYNLTAIVALFALAFMTWVISWQLENILQENLKMLHSLKNSNAEIRDAYETTLVGWSMALDLRDKETEGHTQRVVDLTVNLARAVGVHEEDLIHISRGALLHDIGKLGVPDNILLKPEKLTEEEWQIMKQHPRYAYGLLYPVQYLRGALDIPCNHHEKWDGTGYPQGLKGEEIPLPARIFAIVDVYDALLYDRPYRKAWEKEKVIEYLKEQSGRHFEPRIVDTFLKQIAA